MKLDLVSESVGVLGGMGGKGAMKVLGAPTQNILETVVREAVQNSWDAKAGKGPVRFGVEAYALSRQQRDAVTTALSQGLRQKPAVLELPGPREQFDAIAIFDRGTGGLGGPLTAWSADEEDGDFARFVFSIGETKPQAGKISKGGTYGFGRSVFLKASALSTIFVHTVCASGSRGGTESRFIAMNWRKGYKLTGANRAFTGRHWWGQAAAGGAVLPIRGKAADQLAASVGMPSVPEGQKGTTILILQPRWSMTDGSEEDSDFDPVEARNIARKRVAQSLIWYVWPRVIDGSLDLSVRWFGADVELSDPANDPRLKPFVKAYQLALGERKAGKFEHRAEIDCQRPIQNLGALGLVQRVAQVTTEDDYLGPPGPLRHVALMRDTRLVVQYLRCPPALDRWEYAGVFVTDPDVDRVFAASEPPTHDYWSKDSLPERRDKVFVNVALKKVGAEAREFANPSAMVAEGSAAGLGPISDELGFLLPETVGPATTARAPRTPRGGGGGSEKKRKAALPSGVEIELGSPTHAGTQEERFLHIPFKITTATKPASIEARAQVVVDGGGLEGEAPVGAGTPEVVGWEILGRSNMTRGPVLKIGPSKELTGSLVITQPPDCTVRVGLGVVS